MRTSLRLALLVGVCFAGLAFAAPSFAAYAPSLIIEQSSYKPAAAPTIDVFIAISPNDDPTAKMTIFSPAGYTANLTAAPGTKIGSVVARVKAKALGGALLTLSGDVLVANPADPTIQAASTQCTGKATHTTIWVLNTSLQGQTIAIPVFVDNVGPYVVQQVCLPSPDVPPPAGAAFGAQLFAADFTINNVFTNAGTKGGYEWASDFTPYTPGTANPNPAGTTESRTYVGLPTTLTLKRAKAKHGFALVGQLSIFGVVPTGIKLDLWGGRKARPAPTATTAGTAKKPIARSKALKASGKYSFARANVKFATYFQTRFENYTTDCTGASPSGLPIPCREERIAAVTSNQVKVTPPPRKKHR